MIKLALNKEEIEYKTHFENTLNIADVYALGNSGAIIEVAEKNYNKSKEILSELGIELEYDLKEDRFEFINKIERVTENIPVVGRLPIGYRFLLVAMTTIVIIGSVVLLNSIRISKSELIGHFWCVEKIIHNGVELKPNTVSEVVIIGFNEKCKEDILFHDTGMIALPGFDSYDTRGNWDFKTDKILTISGMKDFKEIYEGEYVIKTNWKGTMEFVSDKTTIEISRKY